LLLIWLGCGPLATLGNEFTSTVQRLQPLDRIVMIAREAVATALRQAADSDLRPNIDAQAPDARLRLPLCPSALRALVPANQADQERLLVRVACESGPRWTVNVAVRVSSERTVLIARKALPRGALIDPQDFSAARQLQAGLGVDGVVSADAVRGRRLQRTLPAGVVLKYGMLEPMLAVRRGQQVVLLARSASIEIRSSGLALQDARAGERVRVRNLASAQIIEGMVTSDAIVVVQP
jgi:flagella basal body P-ring formation protein FlgA